MAAFVLDILYMKGARGEIRQWQVGFEDGRIWTESGQLNGKLTKKSSEVTPKAKRTMDQQAQLETKSRHKKKIDEGYSKTRPDAEVAEGESENEPKAGDSGGKVFPGSMLANKYQPKLMKYPCYVQPKIDGIRMSAAMREGKLLTSSRKNSPFSHLSQLKGEVVEMLGKDDVILDGELFSFSLKFNDLSGLVRSKLKANPREGEVIYAIFDLMHLQMTFEERFTHLGGEIEKWETGTRPDKEDFFTEIRSKVFRVNTWSVENEEELLDFEAAALEAGLEGIMIRFQKGLYKTSRTNNLLKLKRDQDEEGTIVGFEEENADEEGLVVWKVKDPRGNIVSMRPMGTFEERQEQFANGDKYIGRVVTYRFFELNPDTGIARFPRVVRFRADDPSDPADDEE
jgi:DNA ligase-1